jgi:hypothetical protein
VRTNWNFSAAGLPPFGLVTPLFCRLLRSSVELEEFAEHLQILSAWSRETGSHLSAKLSGQSHTSELVAALGEPSVHESYTRFMGYVNVPRHGFLPFFRNLAAVYRPSSRPLALALLFDQFEELFTRFVERGVVDDLSLPGLPDWRLRHEFFREVAKLFRAGERDSETDDPAEGPRLPPLRYVVSLREEYVAKLDPIRKFAKHLDNGAYHLKLLSPDQAEAAIKEPARSYGYEYTQECYDEIISRLVKEEQYVEPTHVQVVCERLWSESGATLASESIRQVGASLPSIQAATFHDLGGAKGILEGFFNEFLESMEREDCLETLEILERLITASGTRNIVEREELIHAPLREPARRQTLLADLVDNTIVRVEQRLGGHFVEITHEFLTKPILTAIHQKLYQAPDYNRFRAAVRALEPYEYTDFRRAAEHLLNEHEFQDAHRSRERIWWGRESSEVMLRSAIVLGRSPKVLRTWFDRYRAHHEAEGTDPLGLTPSVTGERRMLNGSQLRLVNEQRHELDLEPDELAHVLRSTLIKSQDHNRADVEYWTRRLANHGA